MSNLHQPGMIGPSGGTLTQYWTIGLNQAPIRHSRGSCKTPPNIFYFFPRNHNTKHNLIFFPATHHKRHSISQKYFIKFCSRYELSNSNTYEMSKKYLNFVLKTCNIDCIRNHKLLLGNNNSLSIILEIFRKYAWVTRDELHDEQCSLKIHNI